MGKSVGKSLYSDCSKITFSLIMKVVHAYYE